VTASIALGLPQARPAVLALAPSRIREVANAGMHRSDVLAFWFGESDQPTPDFIAAAATRSIAAHQTFYTQNLGRPALREAIAAYASALQGVPIGPERIAVTGSGVSAIMLAAQTVLSPGDKVVVVTPLWPNVAEIPKILGAQVERFPLQVMQGRWQLDLEGLLARLTPDTRMLIVNSPSNPTGWTIARADQQKLLDHCRALGIWILADEVYERLVFAPGLASAPSFLALATPQDRVIAINSFSKAWRMTGWRVGWLTLPPSLVPQVEKVIEYNTSCVAEFVQQGAIAALTHDDAAQTVSTMLATMAASRARLLAGLAALPGISVPQADGAMYAFFSVKGHPDSMALAKRLVAEAGLGLAPGSAFGPEGEGYLRWCFAASEAKIDQGLARLSAFLG